MSDQNDNPINKYRYRLYREHKYLFSVFSTLMTTLAVADLSREEDILKIKNEMQFLQQLLQGHAEHEETKIHALLKSKDSLLYQQAEKEHTSHEIFFRFAQEKLEKIKIACNYDDKFFLGYELYLCTRNFVAENLKHFQYEEEVLMPELQRLFTDEELRCIDFETYNLMTSKEMAEMTQVLFPHMNSEDRNVFLKDMQDGEPGKFSIIHNDIIST